MKMYYFIIANFPNETMEIAHDLSLEDVQREQSYLLTFKN